MKYALLIAMLMIPSLSFAGIGSFSGGETELFSTDKTSVIVAQIISTDKVLDPTQRVRPVTLRPIATLAGTLDPSLHAELQTRVHTGATTSSVHLPLPKEGTWVVAVVLTQIQPLGETSPGDWIDSNVFTFMPNYSALMPITGLDDPKVQQVINALRKARHPVTQPATTNPTKNN